MPEKYRRHFLKDKEAKELLTEISEKLGIDPKQVFKGAVGFEVVEAEFGQIFLANGKPVIVKTDEGFFPTLVFDELIAFAPKVVVDMGAVPYMCKGANVMAPGIRRFEGDFRKGDFVFVVDEKHGKALAVAEALYDSGEAKGVSQGMVFKNIHYVSDKTWNLIKALLARGC
jgi:PUA domain protein